MNAMCLLALLNPRQYRCHLQFSPFIHIGLATRFEFGRGLRDGRQLFGKFTYFVYYGGLLVCLEFIQGANVPLDKMEKLAIEGQVHLYFSHAWPV